MADNLTAKANTGSGTDVLATDEIGGVHYPRTKVAVGPDGSATDVSWADPMPVGVSGTVAVTDNGGSLTVDGNVGVTGDALTALQVLDDIVQAEDSAHASGNKGVMMLGVRNDSWTPLSDTAGDYTPIMVDSVGRVVVQTDLAASTRNEGDAHSGSSIGLLLFGVRNDAGTPFVDDGEYTALSTDENGALRVTGGGGGTQYVEDSAHTTGDTGTLVLAVRRDSAASGVSADGDYTALSVDANGALRVTGGGGGTQYAEDAAHASGDTGTMALAVRSDADTALAADGDYHALTVNEQGRLKVSTVPADLTATTGTITANGQTVVADVSKASNVCLYVTGTFSTVNLTFEASIDGGASWFAIQMVRSNANTVELTTGNLSAAPAYSWEASVNAYTHFRVRATAYTSGTQNVRILPGVYATEPVIATQTTPVTISSGTVTTVTNITNQGHLADNAAFVDGTTRLMMGGYILDETAGTALTENDGAAARVDSKRAQVMVIEDGTTRGATNRATVKAASTAVAAADPALVVAVSPNSVLNPIVRLQTTVTRPADTTAYAAGDALANSTGSPTAGGFTLTGAAKRSGLGGVILGIEVVSNAAPGTPLQCEVWLADRAVTAINDNAAFALSDADALNFLTPIPVVLFVQAGNNSRGGTSNLSVPYQCSGSADLRFLVRVLNAYTPASAETLTVTVWVQQAD